VPEGADYYTVNFDSVNTATSSFSTAPTAIQLVLSDRP
jgi:hypothetical protein